MIDYQERIQRQLEVDLLIKLRGDSIHDKNSQRLAKDTGFGSTAAGKRFTNQALKGFVEKLTEYVEKQLALPATRSVVIKKLINRDGEEASYLIDPVDIGRIVVRSLLKTLIRPEDKRITVTGTAFDIGESVEYFIMEIMIDEYHAKHKRKEMDMLRRQEKLGDPEELRRALLRVSERVELDFDRWSKKDQGSVGLSLLELLYASPVYLKRDEEFETNDCPSDLEEKKIDLLNKYNKGD